MKQRTKFRLGIALMLAAAFASMALAQAAFAQDTTGATGSTNDDQKVVFTWAGTGEPDSVNPMTGYSAIEFYFWTAEPTPAHRLRRGLRLGAAEPGVRRLQLGPGHRRPDQRRLDALHLHDPRRPLLVRRRAAHGGRRRLHAQPLQEQPRLPSRRRTWRRSTGTSARSTTPHRVRHGRTHRALQRREPVPVHVHPAPAHLGAGRAGQLPGRRRTRARRSRTAWSRRSAAARSSWRSTRSASSSAWSATRTGRVPSRPWTRSSTASTRTTMRSPPRLQTGEIDFGYVTTPNVFNTLKNAENIDTMVGIDPVVLRDRAELGIRLPTGRGRLHPARRRSPGAHRPGRAPGDPHGDRQRPAEQTGAARLWGTRGHARAAGLRGRRALGADGRGQDQLGHPGGEPAPRGRRVRRLGRRRDPRDAPGLGGPGPAARLPVLRSHARSRPRSTPPRSSRNGSSRSGSRPRSPR